MTRCLAVAASLAALALFAPAAQAFNFSLVQGEACPAGSEHVTFAEASRNRQELCGRMGQWDIRRLADGGAMDGPGYRCAIRARDDRPMGGALCKPAAMAVPPEPLHAWQPPPDGMQGWSCQPGIGAPLRLHEGDVQCASNNGSDCLWNACNENATFASRWQPAGPVALNPLTCGAAHLARHGNDGYSQANHWCRKGCEIFGCGRMQPVAYQQRPGVVVQGPPAVIVQSPQPVVVQAPPPPEYQQQPPPRPQYGHAATGDDDFKAVLAAVAAENFPSDKQRVLQESARSRWFSVDQVLALYEQEGFGYDKVAALEALAPHLVDRQNGFKLLGSFTFDSEKERAKQILDRRY